MQQEFVSLPKAQMKPADLQKTRILLSPLNWGSGHVARCIPLVHQLIQQENRVLVACSNEQRVIFQAYFNQLDFIEHAPYPFHFGGRGHFGWDLLRRGGALRKRLREEEMEVSRYVKEYNIDCVISDHRYGFISDRVPSVFVTHQLNLPAPWFAFWVQKWHHRLIRRFQHIWVMDDADSRLAGALSENRHEFPVSYIGPFSRFQLYPRTSEEKTSTVFIASGPEIYARQFIAMQHEYFKEGDTWIAPKNLIPGDKEGEMHSWREQDQIILQAKKVVARCGYSTLMDLDYLHTEAELSATPGQREQAYLLKFHKK
ncbi:MAG: hypothetical protein A3D92_24005 [Bacteroidetes bacterium RIFCSPHIGHO2_02_FULL_44_7]|nr:MAG: hypothetical protein A3D92_24005 [Bacteroidetes bacterium RIFCSPHIGHO2_02_FULL_44_7]